MSDRKNIYIFPMVPLEKMASKNPYIVNLVMCLNNEAHVINQDDYSNTGILNAYKYIFKADIFYFNWLENIMFRKMGYIQFIFAYLLLILLKLFNKKIIWTLHNKQNHFKSSKRYDFLYRQLVLKSNLIVLHTKESYAWLTQYSTKASLFYRFHPVSNKLRRSVPLKINKDIDLLIWGTMSKYKGVLDFLKSVSSKLTSYKVHIIGKFSDAQYFEDVMAYSCENVRIENRFAEADELIELHNRSRFVLFPYNKESVLNSGALVDALTSGTPIVGPRNGAFIDLADEGIIFTYREYNDILDLLKQNIEEDNLSEKMYKFCELNDWENFGKDLAVELEKLN